MALSIAIVSDLVCPWCFIGKRRIEAALMRYGQRFPEKACPLVRWLPFELNPDMPPEGMDRSAYLARKFGPANREEIYARVISVGREAGIPFAFDKITRQPNTLAAHCLVNLAGEQGIQDALQEALFKAFFLEGADFTRDETLIRLGVGAGLAEAPVRQRLTDEVARQGVRNQEEQMRRLGISGVPFFIFNNSLAVSGAQGTETLLEAMLQAEKEIRAA